MRFGGIDRGGGLGATHGVIARSYYFEVIRAHASLIPAEMIELHSVRNRASQEFPNRTMGALAVDTSGFPICEVAVAIDLCVTAGPPPATIGLLDL